MPTSFDDRLRARLAERLRDNPDEIREQRLADMYDRCLTPPGADNAPRVGHRRCRLTHAARSRGGFNRAARMTPLERSIASRHAARAWWAKATPEDRRRRGEQLLRARREGSKDRLPMMPASCADTPPRPCERCGRADASPYLVHPLRTHAPAAWRCQQHAWAPRHEYGGL